MAETLTTRLGLVKPTPGTGELVDVIDHLNTNWDKVDASISMTICTSGTRPASPFDGQLIRETDTRRVLVWNATQSTWDPVLGQPGCQVRQSSSIPYPHNTETKLSWNTVISDNDFGFISGTDLVIPVIGIYLVKATVRWSTSATGYRRLSIYNAGILQGDQAAPAISGTPHPITCTAMFLAQAGDIVDARVIHTHGSDLNIVLTAQTPNLHIRRIA
jgi:hypothetical protein